MAQILLNKPPVSSAIYRTLHARALRSGPKSESHG